MKRFIDKLRKEAEHDFNTRYYNVPTWRNAILEAIFRPEAKVGGGRGVMTHLHPEHDKLHLPPQIYIADWRKYRVEDHPMLVEFQKRCHASGLHDPWLRNYAHMLYPNNHFVRSTTAIVTQQLGWGFCAAVIFFVGQKTYLHFFPYIYDHTPEYVEKYGTRELH